jgi:transposase-like protein
MNFALQFRVSLNGRGRLLHADDQGATDALTTVHRTVGLNVLPVSDGICGGERRNGRRRYDPASKDRLVAACLDPGVSVSRPALEHGINANLLRKWIKKRTETQPLPPSSSPAFIPVQIESTSDRALLRPSSVAVVDLPGTCDGVRGSASKRAAPFFLSSQGERVTAERREVDAGIR